MIRPAVRRERPGSPRPKIGEPPACFPAAWTREPTRHLIYHIWPHNRSDNWRWNVRQLLARLDLFDGVRSIGVVTGDGTATLQDVQAEFGDARIDHWFETPNQELTGATGKLMRTDKSGALLGEGLSFLPLMHTLPRGPNDVTFYGHAKGSRYQDGHIALRWADVMYRVCLDDWAAVRSALERQPMAGCFKNYEYFKLPRNWHWHYSGTFFWFRNADVFGSPSWPRLAPAFYGQIEAWPAGMFQSHETACLFGDGAKGLYHEAEMARWEQALPGLLDSRFYAQEVARGFTTTKWDELLALHAVLANTIRGMGCRTVLEIGSGLGAFLIGAAAAGLDATGFDRNREARDFALTKGADPSRYTLADITAFHIARSVDVVVCVETFEHLTDEQLDPICRQLANNCRWLYFTSTPHTDPTDREWGHVNLKSRDEWIAFFARYGLTFDRDDATIVPWGLVFRSAGRDTLETER